jgi:hypothetical protein
VTALPVTIAGLVAAAVAAADPGAVRDALSGVLAREPLQRELPVDRGDRAGDAPAGGGAGEQAGGAAGGAPGERRGGGGAEPGARRRPAAERTRRGDAGDARPTGWVVPGGVALGAIARGLLWVLVAVAGALAIAWAVRELGGRRRARRGAHAVALDHARAAATGPPPPLPDPDRLAGEGRWAEAVHALLLRAVDDVGRRAGRLPPALTAREIAARAALADDARRALGALVAAGERAHFGGAAVGEPDYRSCREQLARLAAAAGGGA